MLLKLCIKIAKPESLFRLKKDSIRDKDRIDAIILKKLIEAKLLKELYGIFILMKHISEKWLIFGTLPTSFSPSLVQKKYLNFEAWKKQTSIETNIQNHCKVYTPPYLEIRVKTFFISVLGNSVESFLISIK